MGKEPGFLLNTPQPSQVERPGLGTDRGETRDRGIWQLPPGRGEQNRNSWRGPAGVPWLACCPVPVPEKPAAALISLSSHAPTWGKCVVGGKAMVAVYTKIKRFQEVERKGYSAERMRDTGSNWEE